MRQFETMWATISAVALVIAGCTCDRKDPAPAAASSGDPTGSASVAEDSSETARPLELFTLTEGQASFVMDAKAETLRGNVSGAQGDLQFDFADLTRTRGMVALDLTTLKTSSFGEAEKDAEQTLDALTWLELHARSAPKELQERQRLAVFTLLHVDKVRPKALTELTGNERSAVATVSGDLRFHGVTVRQTLEIEATFQFEGERVRRVRLKTDEPFELSLAQHEVRPRDKGGQLLEQVPSALQDKIAERVHVTLDFTAESTGKPAEP